MNFIFCMLPSVDGENGRANIEWVVLSETGAVVKTGSVKTWSRFRYLMLERIDQANPKTPSFNVESGESIAAKLSASLRLSRSMDSSSEQLCPASPGIGAAMACLQPNVLDNLAVFLSGLPGHVPL